jgi:heavy metal translocating P-type ATPase
MKSSFSEKVIAFKVPLIILCSIMLYIVLLLIHQPMLGTLIIIAAVILGTYGMVVETIQSLLKKHFALDYIALLAIVIALFTKEYLVAGILALMISGGETLEAYGVSMAKMSLTKLIDRIPTDVLLWIKNQPDGRKKLPDVTIGDEIFIPKGGVIPLDGELVSEVGETDESSLTGEPYFIEKTKGDIIRSGTVNIGQPMVIRVTKTESDSTYKKIIDMVKAAEEERSPMVRLADQYSTYFTGITFVIATFAYVYSGYNLLSVLAVLAVATPCPLIIATPIALLGGMNAAAKKHIIMKHLAALEALSRVNVIVFDKTGTITLGTPTVVELKLESGVKEMDVLRIADAVERNSLHPFAKAIVQYTTEKKVKRIHATNVKEILGRGIEATVDGKTYMLEKKKEGEGMGVVLTEGKKQLAEFLFTDAIKEDSKNIIRHLDSQGIEMHIFTGDKQAAAEKVVADLGENVHIKAECTPEDKQEGIKQLKKQGKVTAMVGDGINDAPALALADVGIAYGNQEQSAATDAADIVLLGGDFTLVYESWQVAKKSVAIAKQSIVWGIGLSVVAMGFAAFGVVPPLVGAGLQEAIDVAVILNALRASR